MKCVRSSTRSSLDVDGEGDMSKSLLTVHYHSGWSSDKRGTA